MLTNQSIGYIDAPIPKGLDLKEEINRMRREKNAVILAHYYQTGDIQDIADFVGDSLALAQQAAKTTADIIVFCGVHFMGETAKVLCPDKKVLVPDLNAGCSLADSCPAVDFAEFVKQHPGHVVISYVNTTAAVKAVTDVVVTSTNARQIVESFPEDTKIIFGPDRNLGNYINGITGRKMLLWDGACHVHEQFSLEKILELKKQYPGSVYDTFLPSEGTPYPFVYLADSDLNDRANKTAVFGIVSQTIHVWHDNPRQRGTVSQMILQIKQICRQLEHTGSFSWSVQDLNQRILPDTTTNQPLLHGIVEVTFLFS